VRNLKRVGNLAREKPILLSEDSGAPEFVSNDEIERAGEEAE